MRRIAPHVINWVERMNTEPAAYGDYLPDDVVPDTLLPLLRHAAQEYLPVAFDTVHRVEQWISDHPGEPVPRFLGKQTFQINGVTEERTVWTCMQYMIQRPLALYQDARGERRAAMDQLLSTIGVPCDLTFAVRRPVRRVNYQLVAAQ
jgi:hypothetical protein